MANFTATLQLWILKNWDLAWASTSVGPAGTCKIVHRQAWKNLIWCTQGEPEFIDKARIVSTDL